MLFSSEELRRGLNPSAIGLPSIVYIASKWRDVNRGRLQKLRWPHV